MTPTPGSNIVGARAQCLLLVAALFFWSMPAGAQRGPERASDKDVKALIDQVDEGRDKFEGSLEGKFKGSTVRGPAGVQASLGKLEQAFGLTP